MTAFPLTILTPEAVLFDGQAEALLLTTIHGEVELLARHMDYAAPLGEGRAVMVSGGRRRTAFCKGGMVTVLQGAVTLLPVAFQWNREP